MKFKTSFSIFITSVLLLFGTQSFALPICAKAVRSTSEIFQNLIMTEEAKSLNIQLVRTMSKNQDKSEGIEYIPSGRANGGVRELKSGLEIQFVSNVYSNRLRLDISYPDQILGGFVKRSLGATIWDSGKLELQLRSAIEDLGVLHG